MTLLNGTSGDRGRRALGGGEMFGVINYTEMQVTWIANT